MAKRVEVIGRVGVGHDVHRLVPGHRLVLAGVHIPAKEAEFLTVEESERLVEALIGKEYELPILVGLYCAMRPAEYCGLRWRDVDLDAGEFRVTQNVHRVRNDEVSTHMGHEVHGFRFGPAKTHRSKRPISMPPFLVELLRVWKSVQAGVRLRAGGAWTDLDLVFTDALATRTIPTGCGATSRRV